MSAYADAGVDYEVLDRFKRKCMRAASATDLNLYRGRRCQHIGEVRLMLYLLDKAQRYVESVIADAP